MHYPQVQVRHSDKSNLGVPPARFMGGMATLIEEESNNYKEAMTSSNSLKWKAVVEEDMKSL